MTWGTPDVTNAPANRVSNGGSGNPQPILSTAGAGIVFVTTGGQSGVASVSSPTLGSFTPIAQFDDGSNFLDAEIWAAISAGPLTNETITVTLNQPSGFDQTAEAFSVPGSNQTSLVGAFDSGGPVTAENNSGNAIPVNFTNVNPNVMLIAAMRFFILTGDADTSLGWANVPASGSANPGVLLTEYQILTSATTTSISSTQNGLCTIMVAVGLIQASGGGGGNTPYNPWPQMAPILAQ